MLLPLDTVDDVDAAPAGAGALNGEGVVRRTATVEDDTDTTECPASDNPPGLDTESQNAAGAVCELLACISCRSRKLKCDRIKPVCGRCAKVGADCLYPEARKKPVFRRRNVKELENRLALLESLLREAGKPIPDLNGRDPVVDTFGDGSLHADYSFGTGGDINFSLDGLRALQIPDPPPPPLSYNSNSSSTLSHSPQQPPSSDGPRSIISLRQYEALPPFEVVEDLHNTFFTHAFPLCPILHPGRYLASFHSAPHLRPPMCLQYAVWTLAAFFHSEYKMCQEIFYRRARRYLEEDELKGCGDQFVSVAHAQAWSFIANFEAATLFFTRCAMSWSRCARLVHMMGLHLLDKDATTEIFSILPPPQTCVELEERRRLFWAAFAGESHVTITTGLPCFIDHHTVTTRLPCSDDAFFAGRDELNPRLNEIFKEASPTVLSTFGCALVVYHIFNNLLTSHLHHPQPHDNPHDLENGQYWIRHREIEAFITKMFLSLPERNHIQKNPVDFGAIYTRLSLLCAVLCLYMAAMERANLFNLPPDTKGFFRFRLLASAASVVEVMKIVPRVPCSTHTYLASLGLYCACSVYIFLVKQGSAGPTELENLDFLVACMADLGRDDPIMGAYLGRAVFEFDRNGVSALLKTPWSELMPFMPMGKGHKIPLVARSSVWPHAPIQDPLGGWKRDVAEDAAAEAIATSDCGDLPPLTSTSAPKLTPATSSHDINAEAGGTANKRKRLTSSEPLIAPAVASRGAGPTMTAYMPLAHNQAQHYPARPQQLTPQQLPSPIPSDPSNDGQDSRSASISLVSHAGHDPASLTANLGPPSASPHTGHMGGAMAAAAHSNPPHARLPARRLTAQSHPQPPSSSSTRQFTITTTTTSVDHVSAAAAAAAVASQGSNISPFDPQLSAWDLAASAGSAAATLYPRPFGQSHDSTPRQSGQTMMPWGVTEVEDGGGGGLPVTQQGVNTAFWSGRT